MTNAGVEAQDAQKVETAVSAIRGHDYATAQRLLAEVTANAPARYEFLQREGPRTWVKCWTYDEFLAYVNQPDVRGSGQGEVLWKRSAYPRAFFLLAHMDVEERRFEEALRHLFAALRLEPDHPDVLYEVGLIHSLRGQHEKGLQFMEAALTSRPFNTDASRARVLRGIGVALIDLNRFQEAEARFKESLQLQPENESALRELQYIQHLRDGGDRTSVEGDWTNWAEPPPTRGDLSAAAAPTQADGGRSAATQESDDRQQSRKAWGMTDRWITSITCPSCTAQEAVRLYRSINVTLEPELKAPLLQQELTRHRCSRCGSVISLNHDLLYHDDEKRLTIHLVAPKAGAAASPEAVTTGYTLRRVVSLYELIQKVRIAERGLDDRVVEALKLGVCSDLVVRYADFLAKLGVVRLNVARVLFLDWVRIQAREQVVFLFLVDEDPTISVVCLNSPITAYHEMAERVRREPLAIAKSGAWHTINFSWAQSLFGKEALPVEIDVTWEPRLLGEDPVANAIWTHRMAATGTRRYVVELPQTDPS